MKFSHCDLNKNCNFYLNLLRHQVWVFLLTLSPLPLGPEFAIEVWPMKKKFIWKMYQSLLNKCNSFSPEPHPTPYDKYLLVLQYLYWWFLHPQVKEMVKWQICPSWLHWTDLVTLQPENPTTQIIKSQVLTYPILETWDDLWIVIL